eukprot:TRINITY_DN4974_c0_g1_i1.p1 TRINITY_DN4974_c0_g1~~TRINITY_DN4974_c0_g1_i1.p1  ORF type:complete len:830 (+),score=195.69 TRINITY_DN4974_c0_g1_i1:1684-4173(+)
MKNGLEEGTDFVVLPITVWSPLVLWYGSNQEFRRSAIKNLDEELEIELFPLQIVVKLEPAIVLQPSRKKVDSAELSFSRILTVKEVKRKCCMDLMVRTMNKIRLWHVRNVAVCLEDDLDLSLEELNVQSGDTLVLERQSRQGIWPRGELNGDDEPKIIEEFDIVPGMAGLKNLGNTCFMNSGLQCLSNTDILTEYFSTKRWCVDVNTENPLGFSGNVAKEYNRLIDALWPLDPDFKSNSPRYVVEPRKFKSMIGMWNQDFGGFRQQDSQEFLGFLLDGLHEDLNRVKDKPFTPNPDFDGQPDEELAQIYWENYLKRNQSIIQELFAGQLRSTRESDCGKKSVTFDPYTFLSLPLPMDDERGIEIIFFYLDQTIKPQKFSILIDREEGTTEELYEKISEYSGVKVDHIYLASMDHGYFDHKSFIFDEFKTVRDCMNAYEVRGKSEEMNITDHTSEEEAPKKKRKRVYCNVSALHRKISTTKIYIFTPYSTSLFSCPFILSYKRKNTTYRDLYDQIHEQLQWMLEPKKDLNGNIRRKIEYKGYPFKLSVTTMDGTCCPYCPWYKFCTGCEIEISDEVVGNEFDHESTIAIDWKIDLKDLHYIRTESRSWYEQHPSIEEHWNKLNKPIPLDRVVSWFNQEEDMEVYCGTCEKDEHNIKKMDLWNTPPILIVHLKRFQFYNNRWKKSNRLVEFPLEGLDVTDWIISETEEEDNIYDLYACVNHYGRLGGGHYTAFGIPKAHPGEWHCFDDSRVTPIPEDKYEEEIVSPAGYLLFYRRRNFDPQNLLSFDPPTEQEVSAILKTIPEPPEGEDLRNPNAPANNSNNKSTCSKMLT